MMTPRERFTRILTFESTDYIPNMEWGVMSGAVLKNWREQGFPEGARMVDYFGLEGGGEGIRFGMYDPIPGAPGQGVIEESSEKTVLRDCWGTVSERPKGKAKSAYHITRPGITCREDWDRFEGMFDPHEPLRYPSHWQEGMPPLFLPWHTYGPTDYRKLYDEPWDNRAQRAKNRNYCIQVEGPSMFGDLKETMGFENYCIALCQEPDLIEEIMETRTRVAEVVVPTMMDALRFDILHFWEDIAFNNGPVVPPDMIRSLGVPRYKRVIAAFRERGGEIVSLDSDGDIRSLIPAWLDAGINHFWPMEVKAHMLVDRLRKEYGHAFSMRGGIAKGAIVDGKDAIDRELDRVAPVVQDGGYIPMLDHGIPPETPFDNFCYYMEQKKKLLGQPHG